MTSDRLYPPNMAGTLPSFHTSFDGATTQLVVPFSMNMSVSALEVKGLRIRIKETATDTTLAQIDTTIWGENEGQLTATFTLGESIVRKMVVGNHYKIQIAYMGMNDAGTAYIYGYYSTPAIVKYTAKPQVKLVGLQDLIANIVNSQQFIGSYYNSDSSEKVYQYKFILSSITGEILEDSDWLLHNSYNDTSLNGSTDTYTVKYYMFPNRLYRIQYLVMTNNGLEASSVTYQVIQGTAEGADLEFNLRADLDYDNGRVKVFIPNPEQYPNERYIMGLENGILAGTFVFTRASASSNYQQWEILANFTYQSSYEEFIYWDYTVAAGEKYQYALQKYNAAGVFSQRRTSNKIAVSFEDIFLFDGTRQLKVRYNPKVTSFKEVVSDTKKTTLGSKFPFILRNGIVNYKEFPVGGLLSYLSDNDKLFMSAEELNLPQYIANTTDITDENIAIEKCFKLAALEWLNNGGLKVFRSPQEGNYIVRLMNVSLSPNETLSRMLHTFTCTATQVSDFNLKNLEEYSLTSPEVSHKIYNTYESRPIYLRNFVENQQNQGAFDQIPTYDLTSGKEVIGIRLEYMPYGSIFQWGTDYNFITGPNGYVEIMRDTPVIAPLYLLNPRSGQTGQITLILVGDGDVKFESAVETRSIIYSGFGYYGIDEVDLTEPVTNDNLGLTRNILEEFNTYSQDIKEMYQINYVVLPEITLALNETVAAYLMKYPLSAVKTLVKTAVFVRRNSNNPNTLFYELLTGFTTVTTTTANGQRYTHLDTVTTATIADYKKRFYLQFADAPLINVTELTGDTGSFNVVQDIPKRKDGTYYLAVGGCVGVEMYFAGTYAKYEQQYNDMELKELTYQEDIAYRDYLAKRFNLRLSNVNTDTIFMVYENRGFTPVTLEQAEDLYFGQQLYSPLKITEIPYTDNEIAISQAAALSASQALTKRLQNLIDEAIKKEEGIG